jgi:hypothetical protein
MRSAMATYNDLGSLYPMLSHHPIIERIIISISGEKKDEIRPRQSKSRKTKSVTNHW